MMIRPYSQLANVAGKAPAFTNTSPQVTTKEEDDEEAKKGALKTASVQSGVIGGAAVGLSNYYSG